METVNIQNNIFLVRGIKVMIDSHMAEFYNVETRALNQAVKRNPRRFPEDFMFQLSVNEWQRIKNEIEILHKELKRPQMQIASRIGKHLPYAFTELGVAMLSSVLKSKHACEINITIMRAFITDSIFQMVNSQNQSTKR